ncbi:MAG: diaminopimelate epimerase [Candidatus Aureabacteria bacterium]|nr:diaminopimelate epimerase [Candidatus Auribacterota bacterium]
MRSIFFTKMSGTGNDFILIDNREPVFPDGDTDCIRHLCNRKKGIGADGIILVEKSVSLDFKMRIINPDGSEVSMCGNGARCAFVFARMLGLAKDISSLETLAGEVKASMQGNLIRLNMGNPKDYRRMGSLVLGGEHMDVFYVNTGVPHAVVFVQDVLRFPVVEMGRMVRHHELFMPEGTNCNFVEILGKSAIRVRTYERGVEDETCSCGTGTCAGAIEAVLEKGLAWPVSSTTLLDDKLIVDSNLERGNPFQDFYLIGPVDVCFTGKVDIPDSN